MSEFRAHYPRGHMSSVTSLQSILIFIQTELTPPPRRYVLHCETRDCSVIVVKVGAKLDELDQIRGLIIKFYTVCIMEHVKKFSAKGRGSDPIRKFFFKDRDVLKWNCIISFNSEVGGQYLSGRFRYECKFFLTCSLKNIW